METKIRLPPRRYLSNSSIPWSAGKRHSAADVWFYAGTVSCTAPVERLTGCAILGTARENRLLHWEGFSEHPATGKRPEKKATRSVTDGGTVTVIEEGDRVRVVPRENSPTSLKYAGQQGIVTMSAPSTYGPLFYVHIDQSPGSVETGFSEKDLEEVQEEWEPR